VALNKVIATISRLTFSGPPCIVTQILLNKTGLRVAFISAVCLHASHSVNLSVSPLFTCRLVVHFYSASA